MSGLRFVNSSYYHNNLSINKTYRKHNNTLHDKFLRSAMAAEICVILSSLSSVAASSLAIAMYLIRAMLMMSMMMLSQQPLSKANAFQFRKRKDRKLIEIDTVTVVSACRLRIFGNATNYKLSKSGSTLKLIVMIAIFFTFN